MNSNTVQKMILAILISVEPGRSGLNLSKIKPMGLLKQATYQDWRRKPFLIQVEILPDIIMRM